MVRGVLMVAFLSSGSVAWHRAPSSARASHAQSPRHGPVFTQEPSDSVLPLGAHDNQAFINCKAKGNPPPRYKSVFTSFN